MTTHPIVNILIQKNYLNVMLFFVQRIQSNMKVINFFHSLRQPNPPKRYGIVVRIGN